MQQKQTQTNETPCSKDNDSNQSEIDQGDLLKMSKILSKIKKIQKKGHLSHFKKKSKLNNQIFHQMSQFFHKKKNIIEQSKAKKLKETKLAKQKRLNTKINIPKAPQAYIIQGQQTQSLPQYQVINGQLHCHICGQLYKQIHHFYGSLCPPCVIINTEKRNQRVDMKGLTALVTGARIKIGYQITLKLLREGATVFATTRFPNDCFLRYQKQKDYNLWKYNLFIIQCDFLSQAQVTSLINYIQNKVVKLDILINNAAQTIVRPQQFYTKEIQNQQLKLQYPNKEQCTALVPKGNDLVLLPSVQSSLIANPGEIDLTQSDQFGQPIDKRLTNTWVQKLQDVSLLDCYTTQLINSTVPFHLISQLKSKMMGSTPSWIINVSSMEGVFYRKGKQHFHPHTNMAKAALNMITRTSASQFKDHNIFMNSVDTGWVTNQNPYHVIKSMTQKHKFKCPLDCIDGAMRVLDPIYQGLLHKQYPYGQFIKNYKPSYW